MAWSDYINTKSLKLTDVQTGLEVLIKAMYERSAPFGGTLIELPKLSPIMYGRADGTGATFDVAPQLYAIDGEMNSLCRLYLKPSVVADLSTLTFSDYPPHATPLMQEINRIHTWESITEVCEYLEEEEIKWFAPLNKKFPADWFEQRIRIINLLTVARYNPDSGYPCIIEAEKERRKGYYHDDYNSYTQDEVLQRAIDTANGDGLSSYEISHGYGFQLLDGFEIKSQVYRGFYYYGNDDVAAVVSSKSRLYNSNSIISSSYDIVVIAKAKSDRYYEYWTAYPDEERPKVLQYDSGELGFEENLMFVLSRYRAENGVAEKTDWYGSSDFYPLPVSKPTVEVIDGRGIYTHYYRGYELSYGAVIDFAVPGGFEFVEET